MRITMSLKICELELAYTTLHIVSDDFNKILPISKWKYIEKPTKMEYILDDKPIRSAYGQYYQHLMYSQW